MKYIQLFEKRTIFRKEGVPYLIRWNLLGIGIDSSWFSIKIHNIRASDEECLHNHPWAFLSIILKGGYTEYTRYKPGMLQKKWRYHHFSEKNLLHICSKYFGAGSFLFRPARWSHRLKLENRWKIEKNELIINNPIPVWTLVFTFKKVQTWGFFTKTGWMPWHKYSEEKNC